MGLLSSFGLKITPNVIAALGARPAPSVPATQAAPPRPAAPAPAAPSSGEAARQKGSPIGADAAAKQAAQEMKAKLEARHKAAYAAWQRLEAVAPKAQALIDALQPGSAERIALQARKKKLDDRLEQAQKEAVGLQADLEKLGAMDATREDYVRILAKHKSTGSAGKVTEIDTFAESLEKRKPGEKHESKTVTSYENGKAVIDKTEEKRSWGPGGASRTKRTETETLTGKGSVKVAREEKTAVSITGKYANDVRKSVEVQNADGTRSTVEKARSLEISAAGVGSSVADKSERADGSASETKRTKGLERGDGKLGGAIGQSNTETDASGTAVTRTGKAKGGLISGNGSQGAFAEGEKGMTRKSAGGVTTGVQAGLHANVVCNVGKPVGKAPDIQYPLTLEVNLGASVGVSTGHDKEGAEAKGKVEAKVAETIFMKRTYLLGEAEAASYVLSLAKASQGSKVGATQNEFAVIALGVKKGWPFARDLFLGLDGGSGDLKAGESREKGGGRSLSGKVSGNLKVVSLEASVSQDEQHRSKATRAQDGTLDGEMSGSNATRASGKVGFQSGAVGMSIGRSIEHRTSSGYVIKIDPKKDPKGERQKAFDACNGQDDYDRFAAKYPECVESAIRSKEDSNSRTVGISVAGADAELGLHNGVKQTTKTGKDGKLIEREVVGSAGGGGSVGFGQTRIGDTVDDEATARLDGDDNASLALGKKRKSTDLGKLIKSKLPFMGDGKDADGNAKPAKGLLATATGAKEVVDTDEIEKLGLTLANKDLDAIAKIASGNKRRWDQGALMDYRNSHAAWEACRQAIVASGGNRQVVANELALFVGGSQSNRLDMVVRFLRPDGDVSIGMRAAFPNALKALQPDFDRLVVAPSETQIATVAAKDGPQKADAIGKEIFDGLESLLTKIMAARDAMAPAVRAEMMSAIDRRKGLVLAALKANAGKQGEAEEKAALEAEYRRSTKTCLQHQFSQNDIFEKFGELWAPGRTYNNVKLVGLLQQARDLFAVWKPDYARAVELARQIGYPEAHYGHYEPAYARLAEWEKKIHQY